MKISCKITMGNLITCYEAREAGWRWRTMTDEKTFVERYFVPRCFQLHPTMMPWPSEWMMNQSYLRQSSILMEITTSMILSSQIIS